MQYNTNASVLSLGVEELEALDAPFVPGAGAVITAAAPLATPVVQFIGFVATRLGF